MLCIYLPKSASKEKSGGYRVYSNKRRIRDKKVNKRRTCGAKD